MGEPERFSFVYSNQTLPPPYQWQYEIMGAITSDNVSIRYKAKEGHDSFGWSGTLEGEMYERCLQIVQSTRVQEPDSSEMPTGGDMLHVTLEDARGNTVSGPPSNSEEWVQLEKQISRMAQQPEQVGQ